MRLFGQKLFVGALALSFLAGPFTTLANHPKAPTNPGFDPANLDTKCKPCEDFNQFANGGWVAKTPIPGAYPAWDTFNEVHKQNQDRMRTILEQAGANSKAAKGSTEQQIGDFYASGMDLEKIEAAGTKPLQPELKRIDGIRNADDLLTTFAHFQAIGVTTPFKFGSDVDLKDSSKVIAGVNQSGLGLPNRDYYTKTDEKSVKTREEYVKHVAKMLELIGEDPASTTEKAKTILAIETKLAEKSMTPVQLRDPNAVYHLMTQEEFQKLTPSIQWKNFFQVVNPPKFTQVNVAQPEFMQAVNGFMTDISINDWKTYLRWHLVDSTASYLSAKFVDQNFEFNNKYLSGAKEQQPRWIKVVSATHKYLGEAVGQEFVRKHFSPESKKRVLEILKNISGALSDRIDTLSWMSPETKKQAQEKLATITPKIGYPDKWRDFSSLTITRDSYAANVMAARQFEYKRDLAKIGKPIDKTEWFSPPQEVNAYYNPLFNEIVFMAGILQPPFFDPNADDAINYGGIGAVIGHEIIHGFDDSGRQFDKEGNLKDWWTKTDETSFVERAGCIEKQFSAYEVEKGVNVNGQLVLGESIADLGGLNLAYNAFQKSLAGKPRPKDIDGFTPEQRFFLGWAQVWRANSRPEFLRLQVSTDEHPPAKFRINGPLSNMPAFAKAFGCQANQPMVRGEGCEIW